MIEIKDAILLSLGWPFGIICFFVMLGHTGYWIQKAYNIGKRRGKVEAEYDSHAH